jgi:hypothetical protein
VIHIINIMNTVFQLYYILDNGVCIWYRLYQTKRKQRFLFVEPPTFVSSHVSLFLIPYLFSSLFLSLSYPATRNKKEIKREKVQIFRLPSPFVSLSFFCFPCCREDNGNLLYSKEWYERKMFCVCIILLNSNLFDCLIFF